MSAGRKRSSITLENIGAIQDVLKNLIRIDSQERIERSKEKLQDFYKQKQQFLKRSLSQTAASREEDAERLRGNYGRRLSAGSRPTTSTVSSSEEVSGSGSRIRRHRDKPTTSEPLPLGVIHEAHHVDLSCTESQNPVEVSISPLLIRRRRGASSAQAMKIIRSETSQAAPVMKRIFAQRKPVRTNWRSNKAFTVQSKENVENHAAIGGDVDQRVPTGVGSTHSGAPMPNGPVKTPLARRQVQGSEHSAENTAYKSTGTVNCSATLSDADRESSTLSWGGICLRRVPPKMEVGRKFSVNQCIVTVQLRRTVRPITNWRKWNSIDLDALVQQGPRFCRILWQTKRYRGRMRHVQLVHFD